jgi:hypothetical protein
MRRNFSNAVIVMHALAYHKTFSYDDESAMQTLNSVLPTLVT